MKVEIEVKDEAEAAAIRTALADPTTHALVVTFGALHPLTPRARKRVLTFVSDKLEEAAESRRLRAGTPRPVPECGNDA